MVESEMADLARENGLRSREVCQGLEDPDHSHSRCRLTVPTGGHDAAAPNRRSSSPTATSSNNTLITLPVTRRAHEVGRAGPVPVAPWVTDRNPPRSEVRAPPLLFPEDRRRRVRPTQTL